VAAPVWKLGILLTIVVTEDINDTSCCILGMFVENNLTLWGHHRTFNVTVKRLHKMNSPVNNVAAKLHKSMIQETICTAYLSLLPYCGYVGL
jgi:hypothetical protein